MVAPDTILDNLHRHLARPEEVLVMLFDVYCLCEVLRAEVPVQLITSCTVLLVGNVMLEYGVQRYRLASRSE